MKRLLALLLGGLGLRALLRSRRPAPAVETRATAEAQFDEADAPETSVDDRRADVHARARQTIDELKSD